MRKISVEKVGRMLYFNEGELLKYICRTQGEKAAPLNQFEAAIALGIDKSDVRRAFKRLVEAKVLVVDEENGVHFKINEKIFIEQ